VRRRVGRVIVGALGTLLLLAVLGVGFAWSRLHASLPVLQGTRQLAGLAAPVTVQRDARGVPTVVAASRADAAAALGFLHAQDRFFQMDLLRRSAAGELAELVGRAALAEDRRVRVHRFRTRAAHMLSRWSAEERHTSGAYARGVRAGLDALRAPPFEYLLLRVRPVPWREEDTILVALAMFLDLQDGDGVFESARGLVRDIFPDSLATFLLPDGGEWDAPLEDAPRAPLAVPGPRVLDLRPAPARSSRAPHGSPNEDADLVFGSNSWAVDARHAANGRAMVAGDMHLGLRVPNIWYRARLEYPEAGAPGGRRRVTGVTLPGTPVMIAGSNGDIAWAFTNSEVDASDLVVIEPEGTDFYRTPDGPQRFDVHTEILRARGGADDTLQVRETIWGPVVDRDHAGRERVLRWVAHDDDAVNLQLLRLEGAASLDGALALAGGGGIPVQNAVIADRTGRIGWTLLGKIPLRFGHDGRLPSSWVAGTRGWRGGLADVPRVVEPASGRLWTANQRLVDGDALARIGDGGYALGARARQIRDALMQRDRWSAQDMLDLQLDDRALFLERWRRLFLAALPLDERASSPRRGRAAALVEDWGGRAATSSAGYRIVRTFRDVLSEEVLVPVTAACVARDPRFRVWHLGSQREYTVWRLLSDRPLHLLDSRHASWDACVRAAVDSTIAQLLRVGPDLAARTWGERNTVRIQHPLSLAVPALGRWLDMPRTPLPGDAHMPRVQSRTAGASQRFVIAPGDEAAGFFHMPGGQSGHPLSPHFRDGHAAWEIGAAEPFLPGPAPDSLVLRP